MFSDLSRKFWNSHTNGQGQVNYYMKYAYVKLSADVLLLNANSINDETVWDVFFVSIRTVLVIQNTSVVSVTSQYFHKHISAILQFQKCHSH